MGKTYMDVPRLGETVSICADSSSNDVLLNLALLQVVHVDMDAIYER
jgi:hypothetical protein